MPHLSACLSLSCGGVLTHPILRSATPAALRLTAPSAQIPHALHAPHLLPHTRTHAHCARTHTAATRTHARRIKSVEGSILPCYFFYAMPTSQHSSHLPPGLNVHGLGLASSCELAPPLTIRLGSMAGPMFCDRYGIPCHSPRQHCNTTDMMMCSILP